MIKRLLIPIIICVILFGGLGAYAISKLKAREQYRQAVLKKEAEKAPETKITIPEGWTILDIAEYLEKNNIVTSKEFLSETENFKLTNFQKINEKPSNSSLEGFLFPDTYLIAKSLALKESVSSAILRKMLSNFENKFTEEMVLQSEKNKLSIYETITLASIVEKEAGDSQEDREIISGIFYNRLNAGVALQSDATVNYVTKKKTPGISLEDTKLESPYNTYKYKGLPPGPIGNPGLNSILAALYPKKTDYFYFLTNPENGRAVFSKTFEEHINNKQKYLR